MDAILSRHRKEQRDLQSQITQKKKSASKKTRKTVNDECAKLEEDLKTRQQQEVVEFDGTQDFALNSKVEGSTDDGTKAQDDILDVILSKSSSKDPVRPSLHDLHISPQNDDQQSELTSTLPSSRKPNRQKARLARRAAEQEAVAVEAAKEAISLPDLKAKERVRMLEEFARRGLKEKEVAANGHCMYSAIADQMRQLGLGFDPEAYGQKIDDIREVKQDDYKIVRQAAANFMETNKGDFEPFLEEPFEEYLRKIRDTGEWGGQLELLALAKVYGVTINVLQGDGRVEQITSGPGDSSRNIWLAYYRHGFGLGEHYNSLRKIGAATSKGLP